MDAVKLKDTAIS